MRVLVVLFALCAFASAYPRAVTEEDSKDDDSSSDTELYVVPLQPRRPSFGFGLSDELAPPPLNQHSFFRVFPWAADREQHDDFATQMQAMLSEMRRQITEMLHHSHSAGALPAGDSGVSVSTEIGDVELPKNKSTSTTKVIDGHVVTVNETIYSSGDDNMGAVFRIKVVEVLPSETPEAEGDSESKPETEVKTDAEAKPEPEPTTNESEMDADKHEETNEIPNQKVFNEWRAETDPSFNEIDQLDGGSDERWNSNLVKKENYYDLHSDTRVNDYYSDRAQSQGLVMIEPDAELVDTDHNSYYRYDSLPQRIQQFP